MSSRQDRRRGGLVPPAFAGTVTLRIERLVLHGKGRADAERIAAALHAELARLAGEPQLVFAATSTPRLPPVQYEAADDPRRAGQAVAASLWSRIRDGAGASR